MIRDHLIMRGMPLDRHGLFIDDELNVATFMLYNLSGEIVGYQHYNPAGSKSVRGAGSADKSQVKYFTYVTRAGETKKIALWGVDTIRYDVPYLFLTEGIFDAVKLHNENLPAVATLCNDPKTLGSLFRSLGKTIICVMDRDQAGIKLKRWADVQLIVPDQFHDLGEMSQDDVKAWLSPCYTNDQLG